MLTLAGVFGIEFYREYRLTKNLRSAFAGELRAIQAAVDGYEVFQRLEETIRAIQTTKESKFSNVRVGDMMHNAIFRANADKLGLLEAPLVGRLAHAHYEINGIAIDLNNLAEIAEGRVGEQSAAIRADWQRCLDYHQHVLARSRETRALIADVINELEGDC